MKKSLNLKNNNLFSIFILSLLISLFGISSCKLTFESNIKTYLQDYTEKAAIEDFKTNLQNFGPAYISEDHPEYYCIPSANDFVLTFELRNPKRYIFSTAYDNNGALNNLALELPSGPYDLSQISIKQGTPEDPEDLFHLTLTYSKEYLNEMEMGKEITPKISMNHPKTNSKFPTYNELKLVSNSAPPAIYGPVVYTVQDKINGKDVERYVLIFNMPSQGLLSGIHQDVKYLTIQTSGDGLSNKAFTEQHEIKILNGNDNSGKFELDDKIKFVQGDPTSPQDSAYRKDFIPIGTAFEMRGQPVYFITDHTLSDKDITYKLILKDEFGLKTSVEANARSVRLSDLFVTANNEEYLILENQAEISQDKDSSYATVNIFPALYTYWFTDSKGNIQNRFKYKLITKFDDDGNEIKEIKPVDDPDLEGVQSEEITENFIFDAEGNITNDLSQLPSVEREIQNYTRKKQNTSNVTIMYEIYQGSDDTGKSIRNGTFNCEISNDGTLKPVSSFEEGKEIRRLDVSTTNITEKNHYLPIEIPSGNIFVRVYAHLKGFADTFPREFLLKVLRTRIFVSSSGDDDELVNNGSENSPFKTIAASLGRLSSPEDKDNTIFLLSDLDLEQTNIEIPQNCNVKITSRNEICEISNVNQIFVPENSSVVLENLHLTNCNITVGAGAKIYLNDVKFEQGIIYTNENSKVILGGNTEIIAITDNNKNPVEGCAYILVKESALIQLGSNDYDSPSKTYTGDKLIVLEAEKEYPTLNTIVFECEDPNKTLKDSYPLIVKDFADSEGEPLNNLFMLHTKHGGYYLGYEEASEIGTATHGKGLIKISAVYVIEPEIGGIKISLYKEPQNNNITLSVKIQKNGVDITEAVSNKKIAITMAGDKIAEASSSEISMPQNYPAGKYGISLTFEYNGIKYSENMYFEYEGGNNE